MNKKEIELVKILHNNNGKFISGENISDTLGVSRTAVWKYIKNLRKKGYIIESVPRRGYHLVEVPDKITVTEVLAGLKTNLIGKEVRVFSSIDSTNNKARELAKGGASGGTIVIAEEQTGGKGRLGRKWYSPPYTGLWFSVIVRPHLPSNRAPFLTIITSLVVKKAINKLGIEVLIKWPNDILIRGKKVCGILSEIMATPDVINTAIIGIGINVNQDSFPSKIPLATSLKQVCGHNVNRIELLQDILMEFENYYNRLKDGCYRDLVTEWKNSMDILGKEVDIVAGNEIISGKVVSISRRGELVLIDPDGNKHLFWAGDVTLRQKD
ncbi:biotin--[acetyl-CoA-carboxylase] ligase [Halothermothrix orenii]|uniref:biotin--[acetyl-CoA-carboxylase] ligase n=1 Tax=Halothermothrix orenii TaxID=31909 RepID=UPI000681FC40|nr:biotin--[acetyl-CoA-carboxylase] ligase [Halothermothrix orenii]